MYYSVHFGHFCQNGTQKMGRKRAFLVKMAQNRPFWAVFRAIFDTFWQFFHTKTQNAQKCANRRQTIIPYAPNPHARIPVRVWRFLAFQFTFLEKLRFNKGGPYAYSCDFGTFMISSKAKIPKFAINRICGYLNRQYLYSCSIVYPYSVSIG